MTRFVASIAAPLLGFTLGYLCGRADEPEQIDQAARAERLQRSYWWAMRYYHPEIEDDCLPPFARDDLPQNGKEKGGR